jgi:predicted DNA-binding ribbon-helix-helix protein
MRPKKRSLILNGHNTSVSLEDLFWSELKNIATEQELSINELVTKIDDSRNFEVSGLATELREFVLKYHINKN